MGARSDMLTAFRQVLRDTPGLEEATAPRTGAGLPLSALRTQASPEATAKFVVSLAEATTIESGERHRSIVRLSELVRVSIGVEVRQADRTGAYHHLLDLEDTVIAAILGGAIAGWQQTLSSVERQDVTEGATMLSTLTFRLVASVNFGGA